MNQWTSDGTDEYLNKHWWQIGITSFFRNHKLVRIPQTTVVMLSTWGVWANDYSLILFGSCGSQKAIIYFASQVLNWIITCTEPEPMLQVSTKLLNWQCQRLLRWQSSPARQLKVKLSSGQSRLRCRIIACSHRVYLPLVYYSVYLTLHIPTW